MEIKDIPVDRLMSSDLVTVTPDTPIEAAGEMLVEHGVGSLMVVDDDDLVGIVTSTDFVDIVTTGTATADSTVADHMSADVVTVDIDDSIRDAAATMISTDIEHLPVENDGSVVGMLSTTDLTAHLAYLEA